MNPAVVNTLPPCLIQRVEGRITIVPLQFIQLRHVRGFNADARSRARQRRNVP